jgi:hypothetical protein
MWAVFASLASLVPADTNDRRDLYIRGTGC